jgi:NhaP-type Na+/H+ or K+/H+ antiporter
MPFLIGLILGAVAAYFFGRFRRSAMGPLGDTLLGVGGGVAGTALCIGLGLPGIAAAVLGGAAGGAAIVALTAALKG